MSKSDEVEKTSSKKRSSVGSSKNRNTVYYRKLVQDRDQKNYTAKVISAIVPTLPSTSEKFVRNVCAVSFQRRFGCIADALAPFGKSDEDYYRYLGTARKLNISSPRDWLDKTTDQLVENGLSFDEAEALSKSSIDIGALMKGTTRHARNAPMIEFGRKYGISVSRLLSKEAISYESWYAFLCAATKLDIDFQKCWEEDQAEGLAGKILEKAKELYPSTF